MSSVSLISLFKVVYCNESCNVFMQRVFKFLYNNLKFVTNNEKLNVIL